MNKKTNLLIMTILSVFTLFGCNTTQKDSSNGSSIPGTSFPNSLVPTTTPNSSVEVVIPEYDVSNFVVYSGLENIDNQTIQAQEILTTDIKKEGNLKAKRYKERSIDDYIQNDFFTYSKDEFMFDEVINGEIGYIFGDIFSLLEVNILTGNADEEITGKNYFLYNDKSVVGQKNVYFDFINENTFVVFWYCYDLLNRRSESILMHMISMDEENPFIFSLDTNSKKYDDWFTFSYLDRTGSISSVLRNGKWTEEIDKLIDNIAYYNPNALLPFVYLKKEFRDVNKSLDFFMEYDVNYMVRDYYMECDNLYLLPRNISQIFMNTLSEPNVNILTIDGESVINMDTTSSRRTVVVPDGITRIDLESIYIDTEDELYKSYHGWYIPKTVTEITSESFKNIALSAVFTDGSSFSDDVLQAIMKYNPDCRIYYEGQWRETGGIYLPNEAYLSLSVENMDIKNMLDKLLVLEKFKHLLSTKDFQELSIEKALLNYEILEQTLSISEYDAMVKSLIDQFIAKIEIPDELYEISYLGNYENLKVEVKKDYTVSSDGLILEKVDSHYEVVGSNGDIDVVIPSYYEGYPVTVIREKAFYRHGKVKNIVIPSTIKEIQADAFNLTFNLAKVDYLGTMNDWVNIDFKDQYSNPMNIANEILIDGENVQEVTLDGSITSIENQLSGFNITSLSLSDNIMIGDGAFSNCIYLEEVVLPTTLQEIPDNLFFNCISLKHVDIPESVKSIGKSAFYGCVSMSEIAIPNSVETIGEGAFSSCHKLEEISLSDNVETIGRSAFLDCKSLTSVKLPSNLKTISDNLFASCSSLETIDIPSTVTTIEESAFAACYSLSDIELPAGITAIEYGTFAFCYSLEEIELPAGLLSIGQEAFSSCYNLKSIVIPETVLEIGSSAFGLCEGMEYLVLPATLEKVDASIFACGTIKNIYVNHAKNDTSSWDKTWSDSLTSEYDESTKKWFVIGNNVYYQEQWGYVDGKPMPIGE